MRAVLKHPAVLVWLCFLAACAAIIARTSFSADLSAFLPRSPSAQQRVLVEQLRDGLVSRLILVGIEGGKDDDAAGRAAVSRNIAATLRDDKRFSAINNGEPVGAARDERFVFDHRYALSPDVTPARFSEAGLHDALGDSLDLLASSAGMMAKDLLPHDPTGEVVALVSQLDSGARPAMRDGVWASRDGKRAVLLAQTASAGSDTDAQASAMRAIREAFAKTAPAATPYRLVMTGPGVFAVETRDTIMRDVRWLSTASIVLIVVLLLAVYRSVPALLLGLMPVLSGVAAGVAAVSLAFGTVHGLTLGFGTTLIGEAVDYSIYLFVQSAGVQRRESLRDWVAAFWPTIRLGVLTSICGFASMLFSGFPGLVQLGLYSIVGLATAGIVTRFVLPYLLPTNFTIRDVSPLGNLLARLANRAARLRMPLALLLVAAIAALLMHRHGLWSQELAALSPVPQASQDLDEHLRADVGAPDVRYLVVVSAASEQAALEQAEAVSARLQPLVDEHVIAGFESPSRYLPSDAAQRARLSSLPDADTLRTRLAAALQDQPIRVKPETFEPFIADTQTARAQPLLRRADLQGTSMALAVDSLLTRSDDGRWSAMLPLRAAEGSAVQVRKIRAALAAAHLPDALFVDMKAEADRLYQNYVREDIRLSLGGFGAIVVLLVIALRSPVRAARTLAPLVAAVVVVIAGLAVAGKSLTILHLIGMLLIVAVGSNYALFFNYRHANSHGVAPQTLVSLLVANIATVAGFGLLALSSVPMLETFGLTVGPGAVLALVFSAVMAPRGSVSTSASSL